MGNIVPVRYYRYTRDVDYDLNNTHTHTRRERRESERKNLNKDDIGMLLYYSQEVIAESFKSRTRLSRYGRRRSLGDEQRV